MESKTNRDETSQEASASESRATDVNSGLIAQHNEEIARVKKEADDNYNLYLRAVADAENARKRSLKELDSAKKFALEGFFKDLLVVLDGFEKAVSVQQSAGDQSFFDGVSIVRKQFLDILEKNGLQEIQSTGAKFDPNCHQAIKRVESSDVSEEIVDCEYAKGYKLFDKLLRPAIVSVLVPDTSKS